MVLYLGKDTCIIQGSEVDVSLMRIRDQHYEILFTFDKILREQGMKSSISFTLVFLS